MTTTLVAAAIAAALFLTGAPPDGTTLQHDADALLNYGAPGVLVELRTPAGSTAVRSGFGDVAAGTPIPWDAEFRIGSTTKPFVAATVLQLVGEGRLALEDTVERWLPGVVTGNGNDGTTITVRQLLQQTSGLFDYARDLTYRSSAEAFAATRLNGMTLAEGVAMAMKHQPNFAPGTEWEYSNTNYLLAGMIIEKITGNSWGDEVRSRILDPLGLHHTYVPGHDPAIRGPHPIGYQRFSPEGPVLDVTEFDTTIAGSAGQMVGTTEDVNRFLQALIGGEVLRPAELAEMQKTVPATRFDRAWPGIRYGLGIESMPTSCGTIWAHGGDIVGFQTRNGITADGTRSVVVVMNTNSFVPKAGTPKPTHDLSNDLIEHALCG